MSEEIGVLVPGENGGHHGHKVRTIVVCEEEGIKALYCLDDKKIVTYSFMKSKGWTEETAKNWVEDRHQKILSLTEVGKADDGFTKIIAVFEEGPRAFWPQGKAFALENGEEEVEEQEEDAEPKEVIDVNEPENQEENSESRVDTDEDGGILPGKGHENSGEGSVNNTQVSEQVEAGLVPADNPEDTVNKSYDGDEGTKARGDGQGQGGPRQGDGGASRCVCPECGAEVSHEKGIPCSNKKCPKCGTQMVGKSLDETVVDISVMSGEGEKQIVKVDKMKQLLYGVFLVPEEADHHGDVISTEDVEKVAHGFIVDYRIIDEMHEDVIRADIVESAVAWRDELNFFDAKLKKGTWFGAVKIHDKDVWNKVLSGEYKGFSVRIAGVREPIK